MEAEFRARHVIAEFYGCNSALLADANALERLALSCAESVGLDVVRSYAHQFPGGGATVFILIKQSHIVLHTWHEFGYAAVDVFTCGNDDPWSVIESLKSALKPERASAVELKRGAELLRRALG